MICPKCINNSLEIVDEPFTKYECQNQHCGQRFGTMDYIRNAIGRVGNSSIYAIESILIRELEEGEK